MLTVIEIGLVVICLCIYLFYLPRLIIKKDVKLLKILISAIVLQNFFCILASNFLGGIWIQIIIILKEIVMYGSIFYHIIIQNKCRIRKRLLVFLLVVIVCIPFMFIGNVDIYTRFICFRQILTPIVLVLYGCTCRFKINELNDIIYFVVNLGILQSIFGICERFILGDSFWTMLHIEKYMVNKGFAPWIYNNGLPGNFYSADLYDLVGSVRRMVGIMADPLLTGHFLAFCLIVLLYTNIYKDRLKKNIAIFLLTIAVLLTLSKGAVLVIGIAFWYKVYRNNKAIALMGSIIPIGMVIYIISNNTFATVSSHLNGLTSSLDTLLGGGMGTSGNLSHLFGGASSTSGESYFGALLGQIGIIGFLTFVCSFALQLVKLLKYNKSELAHATFIYIAAVLIEALTSESAINFVGSGIGFIVFGIILMLETGESYGSKA